MYVGMFSIEHGRVLVRVDATTDGFKSTGHYTFIYTDGDYRTLDSVLSPDSNAVGAPVMAVIEMIRDLAFTGFTGTVELVQPTVYFTETELDAIVEGVTYVNEQSVSIQ